MKRTVRPMFAFVLLATAVAVAPDSSPGTGATPASQGDPEAIGALARIRGDLYEAVRICLHWGGEEPYDEERARQIEQGWARDCGEAVRLGEDALARYPDDGQVAACAVVLVGYQSGPSSMAGGLIGDDATWKKRCDAARRALDELGRAAPDLYSDFEVYAGEACGAADPAP